MNKILIGIFTCLMTFFVFYPPIEGRQYWIALIGTCFLFLILALEMWKKLHWSLALFVLYALGLGFKEFFLPTMYPIPVNQISIAKGGAEILWAVVILLIFSILVLIKDKRFFKNIFAVLALAALLDSIAIIYGFIFLDRNYAMLSNSTADATFIACFFPPLLKVEEDDDKAEIMRMAAMVLFIVAIIITKSNTAIAALGVGFAFWSLQQWKFKKWILTMPVAFGVTYASAAFILGPKLLQDSGRFVVWRVVMGFYKTFANKWIGFGTGTFTVWGDAAQRLAHMNEKSFTLWIWLHNIILEVLFENGIIGVVLMLTVYGFMLTKLFKNKYDGIFPVACVYGFTALLEMPERIWITQILGVCLIAIAFLKDNKNSTRDVI